MNKVLSLICAALAVLSPSAVSGQQFQMEKLNRGVVAIRVSSSEAYVGWRLLGNDPVGISFNLYRVENGSGTPVKLNSTPITDSTNYQDVTADLTVSNSYNVRPIVGGVEQAPSSSYVLGANLSISQSIRVAIDKPAGGTTPDSVSYTYDANDATVADLDGDGDYEIILKWNPTNSKDNSQNGYTGNVYLDAYELDGTKLWRIDLGRNIRAGAHYTQFIAYDLDGDGKAEVACKTADGTVSGTGVTIGSSSADYRNSNGRVLSGPEFLTVFNGQTGAALATTNYIPARGTVSDWGDSSGNRVDRFLAGVAYLDGKRPSLVMTRGQYTRVALVAWDWRDGQLTQRWNFDTGHTGGSLGAYRKQGAHSLTIGDVDFDGRDEIVYGGCTIDDDGTGLYSTGWGHGDALHLSDMDPSRPGLEVWMVHEVPGEYGTYGQRLRDAATGATLVGIDALGADIGRGVAMDIDPNHAGFEIWGTRTGYFNVDGTQLGNQTVLNRIPRNFGIFWDADYLREFLDGTTISKWNTTTQDDDVLFSPSTGIASNNGTKATPCLSADIFGDWREEVIWRETASNYLRIYTTKDVATTRLPTLMHDRQYRLAIAWQNAGYNQPPHTSYFMGDGMAVPLRPNMYLVGAGTSGAPADDTYEAESYPVGGGSVAESSNAGFKGAGYVNFSSNGGTLEFVNVNGGAGGATTITFRYALGSSSRTGNLVVNGATQAITFSGTGSWTTWSDHAVVVTLTAGSTNTIALESTGSDLANIDLLSLPGGTTITVTTASGNGLDDDVVENNATSNSGTGRTFLELRSRGVSGSTRHRVPFLRFDIGSVSGTVTDATLSWNHEGNGSGFDVDVYGVVDGVTGESNWTASGLTYNAAPGFSTANYPNNDINHSSGETTFLGSVSVTGSGAHSLSSPALETFLNTDTNDVVTFILEAETAGSGQDFYNDISSGENTTTSQRPTLVIVE